MDDVENLQGETPAEGAPVLPEETTETPAVAEKPVETPETPEEPKARGVQKRLDELTRNWREAERRNDQLLTLLQNQGKAPEPAKEPEATATKTLADFQYDETAYQAYVAKQVERLAETVVERKLAERAEKERAETRSKTFAQRESEFAAKTDDYLEVTRDPTLPITSTVLEVIAESDIGPELAYHMATNRALADQIAKLPPIQAARELGRIEAKLLAAREAAAKPVATAKVSEAPPPPPRIEGANASAAVKTTDASGDVLSDEQWVAAELKRLQRKNKR